MLESLGCDLNYKLWTAKLIEKNPDAIIQTHLAYIKAGAQCISTASYQASILGLMEVGHSKKSAKMLIENSVRLAEAAIQQALDSGIIKKRILIAGSIGPYGAFLADGSEYRGNYEIFDTKLHEFHLERIEILDQSNTDLLACETIPSFKEAKVLSDILAKAQKPSWVSFSCKDAKHINDGSEIANSVSIFKDHPKVYAIGVNCTHPKYISEIIQTIKETGIDKKIIVYPNSGEAYNAKTKTWVGLSEPLYFAEMAQEWLELGVDIIGGCCRIGPDHIRSIQHVFN